MIFNLPIEPLEERYSKQWNEYLPELFDKNDLKHRWVYGQPTSDKIENGEFLDIYNTNIYKSTQLTQLIQAIKNGVVTKDDTIFIHDGWFPGIEALFYIRDCSMIDFKIYAYLHAGTWDPHDFLNQSECGRWANQLENSWMAGYDKIFVATEFHKSLILRNRTVDPDKIKVVGMPFIPEVPPGLEWKDKEDLIVFPHRLAPEKQESHFWKLEEYFSAKSGFDYLFLVTKRATSNKKEYYDILCRAKIAVSFANQETFGIAMYEASLAGCFCLVPNRLSYPELFINNCRYANEYELLEMIEYYTDWEDIMKESAESQKKFISQIQGLSIRKFIQELR